MSSTASAASLEYSTTVSKPALLPDLMTPPSHDPKVVWRWFWGLFGALLGTYLLLQNPYWVPGGDSDFYIAIARNLALEGKYEYNGLPVAISPPGWPWLMAVVMKVSPTFLALKLFTMACMLASLMISYFIALRFVPPRVAALAVGLAGLLMPVYSLTYFLHSEGVYCLLSAWALLLAFRIREKKHRQVDKVFLFLLCVAIPYIRWAGVFQLLPIVAVLMSARWHTWENRKWIIAAVCALLIIGTWLGTRWSLKLTAEQLLAIKDAGGSAVMETDGGDEPLPTDVVNPELIPQARAPNVTLLEEYGQRFLRSGKWFSWMLWQPTRFAGAMGKTVDTLVTVLGWGVIGTLGYLVVVTVRRGELVWASLALYCGGLCMNWPNPNARYFVPVAPMILLGVLLAFRMAALQFPSQSFNWTKWLRRGFVYTVLLCNLAMYGADVMVMRSSRFYETFEAGQHKSLIDIAAYINSLPPVPAGTTQPTTNPMYRPTDGQIVINEKYENVGRVRFSKAGIRALVLLTGMDTKPLRPSASKIVTPPFGSATVREMRRIRGRWLLTQQPAIPWRVWHFKLPRPLHERFTKYPNQPDSGGWTLYNYDAINTAFNPQPVPDTDGWPTRVPGM